MLPQDNIHRGLRGYLPRELTIVTAVTEISDPAAAINSLTARFHEHDNRPPDFVTVHYDGARHPQTIWSELTKQISTASLHGGSSCLGVMSEQGAVVSGGPAIGAFAIWDEEGSYGTAMMTISGQPRQAASIATRAALDRAGRSGEAPALIWLTAPPGCEEAVLDGIKDVVGRSTPIVGGSSADNDVSGNWSQMSRDGVETKAIVVSVLFPSTPLSSAFGSGYAPAGPKGVATSSSGRTLSEIDYRPAAQVYEEWTGGLIMRPAQGSTVILEQATLFPLGRKSANGAKDHFLLAHPANSNADGSLNLFADIAEGDELWLMEGSEKGLLERAGRLARLSHDHLVDAKPAGGLLVFCGGCAFAVKGRMNEVAASVSKELSGAPFLALFSFGEQGALYGGEAFHGNLMISCTVFSRNRF
jgi:hypothetical protein